MSEAHTYASIEVVCTGYEYMDGTLRYSLRRVVDDAHVGRDAWYSVKQKDPKPQAGMVHMVDAAVVDGHIVSIKPSTFKWKRAWHPLVEGSAMAASQHAAQVAKRAFNYEKREGVKLRALPAMAAMRAKYVKLDHYGKIAMEATIMHYLRTGETL